MQYLKFTVENFKGIERVEIDLVHNRILTLVGLNESGKTTVLEAMQLFYDVIKGKQLDEQEINRFRPKGIDFTGSVNISTTLKFEENDIKILERELKTKLSKKKFTFPKEFTYSFSFIFETHKYKTTKRTAIFEVKPSTGKKTLHESNNTEWQALVTHIKENLVPEILFYEDFVFEIPEKIEFSISDPNFTGTGQIKNNNEWQLVLNDVLKSVNPKLSSFHEHLVKIWQVDSDTARNRLSQMERKLNDKITDAWKELFTEDDSAKKKKAQRINFKEINLVPHLEGDFLSFSFKVKTDSGKEFSMNERSKGCKWFFSFLIFTEFRKNRTKNILFLLDEPASNLHSSAQQKILNAIEQLSDSSVVVYSTHSHYMINPLWLSGAYVVINESISLDQLEGNITEEENAKITAKKYYNYVGSTKDSKQNLYFQPILDRLDYIRSPLDPAPGIFITEGKYDWYIFNYFNQIIFNGKYKLNIFPGGGRDAHDTIIGLYLAWGSKFTLVLDGDIPGQKSKERYLANYTGFVEDKIFTIKDILNQESEIEDLIVDADKKIICDTAFGEGTFLGVASDSDQLKSKLNFSVLQLLINKQKVKLDKITTDNINNILKFVSEKLP